MICDVALEHPQRICGSVFIQVFDIPGERGHISKPRFLHQKDTDLQIGVQPWFDAAEQFQHQAFVIDHRAVALLRVHKRWGERTLSGPPEGFKGGGGDGANLPSNSGPRGTASDGVQQMSEKLLVGECVLEEDFFRTIVVDA